MSGRPKISIVRADVGGPVGQQGGPPKSSLSQVSELRGEDSAPKRAHIVQEIVDTEDRFLQDLYLINDVFMRTSRDILSSEIYDLIFGCLPSLLQLHGQLSSKLHLVLTGAVDIGQCFQSLEEEFEAYSPYCARFPAVAKFLTRIGTNPPDDCAAFAQLLADAQKLPQCRSLHLSHFLLGPVQRICRYPLLLRDLLSNTPDDHEEYGSIEAALEIVLEIADEANDARARAEAAAAPPPEKPTQRKRRWSISFGRRKRDEGEGSGNGGGAAADDDFRQQALAATGAAPSVFVLKGGGDRFQSHRRRGSGSGADWPPLHSVAEDETGSPGGGHRRGHRRAKSLMRPQDVYSTSANEEAMETAMAPWRMGDEASDDEDGGHYGAAVDGGDSGQRLGSPVAAEEDVGERSPNEDDDVFGGDETSGSVNGMQPVAADGGLEITVERSESPVPPAVAGGDDHDAVVSGDEANPAEVVGLLSPTSAHPTLSSDIASPHFLSPTTDPFSSDSDSDIGDGSLLDHNSLEEFSDDEGGGGILSCSDGALLRLPVGPTVAERNLSAMSARLDRLLERVDGATTAGPPGMMADLGAGGTAGDGSRLTRAVSLHSAPLDRDVRSAASTARRVGGHKRTGSTSEAVHDSLLSMSGRIDSLLSRVNRETTTNDRDHLGDLPVLATGGRGGDGPGGTTPGSPTQRRRSETDALSPSSRSVASVADALARAPRSVSAQPVTLLSGSVFGDISDDSDISSSSSDTG